MSQQSFTEQLIEHLSAKGMALLPFLFSCHSSPTFAFLLQQRLLSSPQSLPVQCVEFIRLNNNLREVIVFWGVENPNCLAERSEDTQKQLKAGRDVAEKGKGRNVPSNYSKQLKYPCYSPSALPRYFQHSHRTCFQHTNPSLV